jgi:hypothetical protein
VQALGCGQIQTNRHSKHSISAQQATTRQLQHPAASNADTAAHKLLNTTQSMLLLLLLLLLILLLP